MAWYGASGGNFRHFIVTANTFFGDCRFLGGFIFLVTETSAKSGIEPDPAYSIHTCAQLLGLRQLGLQLLSEGNSR
jgi:hypothetical protein